MRPQKSLDKEVLFGLTQIFSSKGYEGASLQDLATATGLKKASLYHRFPNGKQQMAGAVFSHVDAWVQEHIFDVLNDTDKEPQGRLVEALSNVSTLYDGGNRPCIFRALSMQEGMELFGEQVQTGMIRWIEEFENIGLDLGLAAEIAKDYSVQTLIEIQGSLILVKGLDDTGIFDSALKNIAKRYLK